MLATIEGVWIGALVWLGEVQTAPPDVKFFSLKDPDPDRGLAWFVLNAFFLIAVALAITIGIGIAFGSFRLWLLNKFPNNWFNGEPEDDVSRTLRFSPTEKE